MKRILAAILAFTMMLSLITGITVMAAAEPVTVIADADWENATYDPSTKILTNVNMGYSFTMTLTASTSTFKLTGVSGTTVTAPKVVIPYQVIVGSTTYTYSGTGTYLLTGGTSNTTAADVKEVIFSEGIDSVSDQVFRNYKGLTKVTLPSTMKTIGVLSFAGCSNLAEINIPDGVATIKGKAFQSTGLLSISIPSSVTSFGEAMFYGSSKLASIELNFPYTSLGGSTFRGCSALKSFTLPEDFTTLGSLEFSGSGVVSMVIPEGVTSIPSESFGVCYSLTDITFLGNITDIGYRAFLNNTALTTIYFYGDTAPELNASAFSNCKANKITVYYAPGGVGYDDAAWQAVFPSGTKFIELEGNPSAKNLAISGKNVAGNTLTASYTYSDPKGRPESGSTITWTGCEDEDFSSSTVYVLKTEACTNQSTLTYDIKETDDGKYIRASVTPRNADATFNEGETVHATLTDKVRLPQTIPVVSLIAPSNGFFANANKAVSLLATAECDNTTITRVEFYANDVKVAEATQQPYASAWVPSEMGEYTVYARAYNALGEDSQSSSARVTVLAEDAVIDANITISFTSPVPGSYNLTGSAVAFAGSAVESSGSEITSIDIYANGVLIKAVNSDAFSFEHVLTPGVYEISAVARSLDGKTGYSDKFNITVSGMTFGTMIADNMILQRNKPIKLSGSGVDGTVVTAQLLGSTASDTVANGRWEIVLPAKPANKGTTLTFTTNEGVSAVFNNVAIGEVIMCSGQSNMTVAMGNQYASERTQTYEDIRFFKQSGSSGSTPATDIPTGYWQIATPENIKQFSCVGFIAGKYYYTSQNGEVPVGLISAAVSGTAINRWVPNDAFINDPDLKRVAKTTTHYNTMVAPWTGFTIGHVLWYQGESNSVMSQSYEKSLTAYIDSYRQAFGDSSMSFIIVQLPTYDAAAGYNDPLRSFTIVREGQYNVSKYLDRVATVISIDTGSTKTVHPGGKLEIGTRAALAIQHFADPEQDIIWKSPSFDYMEIDGTNAILHFKDIGEGLATTNGLPPKGFKIAGDDNIFADASATLVGNTVVIDISSITGEPKIRYAFEDAPARIENSSGVNLVNSAGLPMAPFRTDNLRVNFKSTDFTATYNFTPTIRYIEAEKVMNNIADIYINARDYDDSIQKLELYIDGSLAGEATKVGFDMFKYSWNGATVGTHAFYAIATDELGTTSIKSDPSASSQITVTPKVFTLTLSEGAPSNTIGRFTDLDGEPVAAFKGKNGVMITADKDAGAALIIAAYNGNELLALKTAPENSAWFTAAELDGATQVKAFLLSSVTSIKPLTAIKSIELN